jgi:outer membrane protein assembly factor BamB
MRRVPGIGPLSAISLAVLLSGCGIGSWFGEGDKPPLPGDRLPVLAQTGTLEPATDAAVLAVNTGAERSSPDWRNPGGNATHVNGALTLGVPFQRAWSASIGTGSGGAAFILNQPIVGDGKIFAADAGGRVTALDAATGGQLWRVVVANPEEDSTPTGGGVAYADGLVFASTGFGEVLALDASNGGLVWKAKASGPVRAAPTVAQGRVAVVTADSQTDVFDARTGAKAWDHQGIPEVSGLLSASSPAISNGIVVSGYGSGEIYALRIENGRAVWADSLSPLTTSGSVTSIPDIAGLPVVDNDLVVVISNGGRIAGIDMRSGGRVWEQPVGGTQTPWIAGDTIFVVSSDARVVALARNTGQVKWVQQLEAYTDPEDREGRITWTGPVLAGGNLILASNVGQGVLLSPQTGAVNGTFEVEPTLVEPVVVDNTMLVIGSDGTLTAYR